MSAWPEAEKQQRVSFQKKFFENFWVHFFGINSFLGDQQ